LGALSAAGAKSGAQWRSAVGAKSWHKFAPWPDARFAVTITQQPKKALIVPSICDREQVNVSEKKLDGDQVNVCHYVDKNVGTSAIPECALRWEQC
jgi:hypothetical protein